MASKYSTTVVLTKKIQRIKNELAGVYGLKNLLSAGILLFNRLSDSEQKKAIKNVNDIEKAEHSESITGEELYQKLKQHFQGLQMEPGSTKNAFSPDEITNMIIDFIRQHLPAESATDKSAMIELIKKSCLIEGGYNKASDTEKKEALDFLENIRKLVGPAGAVNLARSHGQGIKHNRRHADAAGA